MTRSVAGEGWVLLLPESVSGGQLRHSHQHLRTMAVYRGPIDDGSELEVIVTTYPGRAIGEHGEPLDRVGVRWAVPGARSAVRRDRLTRLDDDPAVPPVATTIIVADPPEGGSVCLVVHRAMDTPGAASEAVVRSLTLAGFT